MKKKCINDCSHIASMSHVYSHAILESYEKIFRRVNFGFNRLHPELGFSNRRVFEFQIQ